MAIGSLSLVTFNNLGIGDTTSDVNTMVKEKIKFFLQTNKGEIVADLNYGADLIHFAMRPIDNRMVQQLATAVRIELALNMSYVSVKKLENISKPDQGSLYFTLHYEVNGSDDNVNIGV
jgi:phage baseplate assembly protein W